MSAASAPAPQVSGATEERERWRGRRLVIFGCGYVGQALAAAAVARDVRVTALTRNPEKAAALRATGVEVVVADLTGEAWHAALPGGPEFAVDCVSASAGTPAAYAHAYVGGLRSILAWAARGPRPVGTLVYTSSTGVYPQGDGAGVDERSPTDGASPTGRVLVEAEQLLGAAPAAAVARGFVLRLAGIYGPGRHQLLDQLRAGATVFPGSGEHRLNLIHRDDVVGAILACLAAPGGVRGGVFNVSDGRPVAKAELLAWLAARLGRPAPEFAPAAPSLRRGGAGVPDRVIVSARIRAELGWAPRHADARAGYAALLGQL